MTQFVLHQYKWLIVFGALGSWWYGWATGSNDVANAFGTSVGAKTLTLWQATLLACVFEFAGAMLLGRVSTGVIAGGIANTSSFARDPEIYAYGMVVNLFVGSAWQTFASWAGLNVSATHTIIGGIIGFALVYAGGDAVIWTKKDPNSFPPTKGVVTIFIGWLIAPLLCGASAALIFFVARTCILRRRNAYTLTFWTLPVLVFITVFINTYFVLTKGAKKMLSENHQWKNSKSAWVACIVAGAATVLMICLLPIIRRRADAAFNQSEAEREGQTAATVEAGEKDVQDVKDIKDLTPAAEADKTMTRKVWDKVVFAATRGFMYDIHEVVEEDPVVAAIHERAERFPPKVEFAFMYLQIFSAICVILAHGAGEVGYMAGPLGAIWHIVKYGEVTKNVKPPAWIVFIGAFGLVVGLATYGYKVTRAMGTQMAKLSPSRGFSAELATAMIIMIAAQYGIPQSSSQCITGAIIGVGLCEGALGVNWKFFAAQFASWVGTLFVSGFITAGIFAMGVYAPCKIQGDQIAVYENMLSNNTLVINGGLNATLFAYKDLALAGNHPTLSADQWKAYNASIANNVKFAKNVIANKVQTTTPETMMTLIDTALSITQTNSINTLGQITIVPGVKQCVNSSATIQNNVTDLACPAPKLLAPAYTIKV